MSSARSSGVRCSILRPQVRPRRSAGLLSHVLRRRLSGKRPHRRRGGGAPRCAARAAGGRAAGALRAPRRALGRDPRPAGSLRRGRAVPLGIRGRARGSTGSLSLSGWLEASRRRQPPSWSDASTSSGARTCSRRSFSASWSRRESPRASSGPRVPPPTSWGRSQRPRAAIAHRRLPLSPPAVSPSRPPIRARRSFCGTALNLFAGIPLPLEAARARLELARAARRHRRRRSRSTSRGGRAPTSRRSAPSGKRTRLPLSCARSARRDVQGRATTGCSASGRSRFCDLSVRV